MISKNCVLICNLGSSDLPKNFLSAEEFDFKLGRAAEYRFVNENLAKYRSRISFPIIDAYLQRIGIDLSKSKEIGSGLKCVVFLIATQQDAKIENAKDDTMELAKLIKEYLKGGSITVKIEALTSNPSSYEVETQDFYHEVALKVLAQAKMLNAEIFCGLTGGTPACNTMLVLQATKILEGAIYLYAARDGLSAQTKPANRIPLTKNLKHYELKHHLIELLESQDFSNAFKVAKKVFTDERAINCFKAVYLESIGHYDEMLAIDTTLEEIYFDQKRGSSAILQHWNFLEHKFVSGSYSLFILFASDYWENLAMLLIESKLRLTRNDRKKMGGQKEFLEYLAKFPYKFDSNSVYDPRIGAPHFNKIDIIQLLKFLQTKDCSVAATVLKVGEALKDFFNVRNGIAHDQRLLNESDSKEEFKIAYITLKDLTEKMIFELKLCESEKIQPPLKNHFSEMATRLKVLVFSKE